MKSDTLFGSLIDSSKDNPRSRNRFIFWISILLAGVFLYLSLSGLDWQAFFLALRNVNYDYLPLMFLLGSFTYFMRALRWQVLLNTEKKIPSLNVFWANMAGYLGNNILPARAGELIRAMYVGRQNEVNVTFALATGLVERFVDVIALIVLGSISLTLSGVLSAPMKNVLVTMSLIGVVGLITIILLPYFRNWINRFITALPLLPAPVKEKLFGLLNQFLRGIEAVHNPKRIVSFVLYTAFIWIADGIGTVFLAYIFHLEISLIQSFLLLAALGLSSAIPSTPGYIGVYQFVAIMVLKPFGISSANALAFILFLQMINLLVISLWGILAIWRTPRN